VPNSSLLYSLPHFSFSFITVCVCLSVYSVFSCHSTSQHFETMRNYYLFLLLPISTKLSTLYIEVVVINNNSPANAGSCLVFVPHSIICFSIWLCSIFHTSADIICFVLHISTFCRGITSAAERKASTSRECCKPATANTTCSSRGCCKPATADTTCSSRGCY
jgi:hypothetical protein